MEKINFTKETEKFIDSLPQCEPIIGYPEKSKSETILNCPFCGSKAECYWDDDGYTTACTNSKCSVQMSPMDGQKKNEVILAWNTRRYNEVIYERIKEL